MENNSEIKLNEKQINTVKQYDTSIYNIQSQLKAYISGIMDANDITEGQYTLNKETMTIVENKE